MLGQHSGQRVVVVNRVVEILDIGAADAEYVVDSGRSEMVDDEVDNA